jgi:glycosyltransferase involved in cell wall biosynthesis
MRAVGDTGVQTHFNAFLRFLTARQHRARCITPFSVSGAFVYPIFGARRLIDPVSGALSVWWYRHWHGKFLQHVLARELAHERAPVMVYAQCPISAAAALHARGSKDHRVVMAVHFNLSQADEWADKGRLKPQGHLYERIKAFEERILPKLDGLVYVSEFMRRELEARVPALRNVRAAVIPTFVDLPARRENGGLLGDLICIGTLEPRKNQQYLLRVLSSAARMGHRYSLTLIGDGPDRAALGKLAQEIGISEQLRFAGYQADAASFISSYRVYCHAARLENFPLAILEAMAEGVPVVAAPVGGIPEMLRSGIEGVFWPLDAPDRAARILIRSMEDQQTLVAMGAAGRRRVEECFATDVAAPRLLDFLGGVQSAAEGRSSGTLGKAEIR